jgi:hypothetical protein
MLASGAARVPAASAAPFSVTKIPNASVSSSAFAAGGGGGGSPVRPCAPPSGTGADSLDAGTPSASGPSGALEHPATDSAAATTAT